MLHRSGLFAVGLLCALGAACVPPGAAVRSAGPGPAAAARRRADLSRRDAAALARFARVAEDTTESTGASRASDESTLESPRAPRFAGPALVGPPRTVLASAGFAAPVSSWVRAMPVDRQGVSGDAGFPVRVALAPDGDVVACVEFQGAIQIEGVSYPVPDPRVSQSGVLVMRTSPAGEVRWVRRADLRTCLTIAALPDGRVAAGGGWIRHTEGSAAVVLYGPDGAALSTLHAAPGLDAFVTQLVATGDGALLVGGNFFRSTPDRVLSLGGRTLTPLHYSDNFTARWETSGVVSRLARTPPLMAATLAGGHGVLVAQGSTLRVEGADGRIRWQRALGASEGVPTGVVALGERGYVFTANNAGTRLRAFALRDGAPVLERAVAPGPRVPLGASRDLLWLAPAERAVVGLDGRNPLPDALVLEALTQDGEPARRVRVSSSAFGFVDGALARPTALVDGSNGVVLGVDLWTRGWDEGALSAALVRVDTNAAGPGAAPIELSLDGAPRFGELAATGGDCARYGGPSALRNLLLSGVHSRLEACTSTPFHNVEVSARLGADGGVQLLSLAGAPEGADADTYRFECVSALLRSARLCPRGADEVQRTYTGY